MAITHLQLCALLFTHIFGRFLPNSPFGKEETLVLRIVPYQKSLINWPRLTGNPDFLPVPDRYERYVILSWLQTKVLDNCQKKYVGCKVCTPFTRLSEFRICDVPLTVD